MSQSTGMPGGRRVQPIQSLNPYMGATWTIRARCASKSEMRTYTNAKGEGNLFNVEFIDEDGTRIEATLWREVAQKYYENIEEGKVYYVSRAGLKPANKTYSSVQNDYQLTFSDRTEVQECKDASAKQLENVKVKLNVTNIADLPRHLGRKTLLDVVGIVANVSPLGSVKRKKDQSELARRDLTIFDSSSRSVSVTLWQTLASEEGEKLDKLQKECPIVALQGVRTNDYNGVSLSTVSRSAITIAPDESEIPEAKALREWYAGQGNKVDFPHCGAGLANNNRASLGGASQQRVTLQDLREKTVPPVGTKPEYVNTFAYISDIKADQNLYYMAAPDGSNKKVTEENGRYYCEGTQKYYDTFIRRYVMRCEVMDHTGSLILNVFNDQAETILGCTADAISGPKEKGERAYDLTLKNALLVPYTFRVMCKPEEYNNQTRLRYAAQNLNPINPVEQSAFLIGAIEKMLPKTEVAN